MAFHGPLANRRSSQSTYPTLCTSPGQSIMSTPLNTSLISDGPGSPTGGELHHHPPIHSSTNYPSIHPFHLLFNSSNHPPSQSFHSFIHPSVPLSNPSIHPAMTYPSTHVMHVFIELPVHPIFAFIHPSIRSSFKSIHPVTYPSVHAAIHLNTHSFNLSIYSSSMQQFTYRTIPLSDSLIHQCIYPSFGPI